MEDDPFITVQDVTALGHCGRGLHRWLVAHSIDPHRFWRGEVRASEFLATEDANGIAVVEAKLRRMAEEA